MRASAFDSARLVLYDRDGNIAVAEDLSPWERHYRAASDVVDCIPSTQRYILFASDDQLYLEALVSVAMEAGWVLHGAFRMNGVQGTQVMRREGCK